MKNLEKTSENSVVSDGTSQEKYKETAPADNTVKVDKGQLQELIEQNGVLKTEVEALVSVYMDIAPFFTGSSNPLKIVGVIGRLMADKEMQNKIGEIIPIIEKYKPIENG